MKYFIYFTPKKCCKVYVKDFFIGKKTRCMKDYIKSSLRDASVTRIYALIAKSTVDLASTLKNELHDVSVSNILVQNNNNNLKKKKKMMESKC